MYGRKKRDDDQNVPDLTDFINDMFFGTVNHVNNKKAYDLTGKYRSSSVEVEEQQDFDSSTRSNSGRLTQEWLQEARRIVASSPTRCESPSRLAGSPRFGRLSTYSSLDRRDPLSRSARRQRAAEGFSGEILTKSAKHSRNRSQSESEPLGVATDITTPAESVQKWCSANILDPPDPTPLPLPPKQPILRKSRFQAHSPPKLLVESAERRSFSSSSPVNKPLSPPRILVESAHRRSISKSTCSWAKIAPSTNVGDSDASRELSLSLNRFLKEQRTKFDRIINGEVDYKAKIVLSGPSNSTSSMVAAICHAWLLEYRFRKSKGNGDAEMNVILPVMNLGMRRMWKQRQAAWLFHHVGLDDASLVFANELDLDSLIMAGRSSIIVIGQDVLRTNSEVGSQCTIITDNYCEDAYELLQTPALKKLLLAGILIDTQNLNASAKLSTARDAEAVQLLLVGSAPNYRNALFDQLMQDQTDNSFFEALRQNYGKSLNDEGYDGGEQTKCKTPDRKSVSVSQRDGMEKYSENNSNTMKNAKNNRISPKSEKPDSLPAQDPTPTADNSRGKNKFSLAKWFGFGK